MNNPIKSQRFFIQRRARGFTNFFSIIELMVSVKLVSIGLNFIAKSCFAIV